MAISADALVQHAEYGPGKVVQLLGKTALVNFCGDEIEVDLADLKVDAVPVAPVVSKASSIDQVQFRRAYEAINLGVVPPGADQLRTVSIGGPEMDRQCRAWLDSAAQQGMCKVVFGDYGSGKSHHLRFCEAVALQCGWVVSFVEFDPKQADPANPDIVYRAIVSGLRFPSRSNGNAAGGFSDLIGEALKTPTSLTGRYLKDSPWFAPAIEALRHLPKTSPSYKALVDWLAGQRVDAMSVRRAIRESGSRAGVPPIMPKTRERAEVYVYHLVVLNELCKKLGYRGLLLILDEAEHVRNYTVFRQERAENFFDLLARSARPAQIGLPQPALNEQSHQLPRYWKQGPHFALVVGLTEGDTFSDESLELREACVFLKDEGDIVRLEPPPPEEYAAWCSDFLSTFHDFYPAEMHLLRDEKDRLNIASLLAERFAGQQNGEKTLRLWTKLTTLVPSMLMAGAVSSLEQLRSELDHAARAASHELLEWEL